MLDFNTLPRFKAESYRIVELIHQWAEAHQVPDELIIRQLPIAHAWCSANPKKAPKKNITRFLNNWMAKAKEFGRLAVNPRVLPPVRHDENGWQPDMSIDDMKRIREQNMKARTA